VHASLRCSTARMALFRPSPFNAQVVHCNDQRGEHGSSQKEPVHNSCSVLAGPVLPSSHSDGDGGPSNDVGHYAGALAAFRTATEAQLPGCGVLVWEAPVRLPVSMLWMRHSFILRGDC
jgi:hypothetical protein